VPTFAPSSATLFASLMLAAAVCIGVGYLLQRSRSRFLAWLWLIASIALVHQCLQDEGAGLRMMALVAVTLYGMKALVGVEHHRSGNAPLPLRNWLAFATVWLGMQPRDFAKHRMLAADARLVINSCAWLVAGATIILCARTLHTSNAGITPHANAYLFLLGCSMITHFGVIGIVVVVLRRLGYAVSPQFRAPWMAKNLQDFWTRRWNIGFSVMTTIAIYRPLAPVLSRNVAMLLAFVASGLLHELACSVPVADGYGLPMIYFVLHGFAVVIETWLARRGIKLEGVIGRVWVYAWVLLPAPLVFHTAFLDGVIVPLL
jgi:hypothetical protein